MLFLEYPKCSTCQKAKKWLDEHQISYEDRHIVENNPTFEELKDWYERSGLPLKKFFQRKALQRNEAEGQAAGNERGGAVKTAGNQWHVGKASSDRGR